MTAWHKTWSFLKWSMLGVLLTLPLAGCLEVLDENAPAQSVSVVGADVVISGSVGDGPVIGATITVYSNSGEVLGSMTSDSSASFRSTLKVKGNQYPLRLVVSGGTDLVTGAAPDFEMSSVMRNPSDRQVNINPFSTLIVMLAERAPGGLSSNNVEAARIIVMRELGFGLDATAVPDPITAEITSANAANLVKASEALGEAIRRTRDAIMASGGTVSGDTVMAALAADLVDGSVDGQGGAAADALTASVANVVSAQVLVETLTNRLRIGGVVATSTIDQAIAIARPDITTAQLTESVTVTGQLIEQTRIALAAAQVLDAGTEVKTLATGVAGLAPGILPSAARAALPASGGLVLTGAANQVALASTTDQVAINQVVALDGSTPPPPTSAGNTPPAIGGSPAGAVQAGSSYQFQPTASDADGDSLSFSISGKPAWASFSNTTGRLGGTPGATDVGSYSGIRIAVTDGTDTTSLAAFAIQVTAAPAQTGIMTLSWVAPTQRADGTVLSLSEIGGYRLYYGTTPGAYSNTVEIADGAATTATITDLALGSYYVVLSTYDSNGLEGAKSSPVIKTVQ
ncbi:MAG: putative Ig domain-containing protein [Pseudomonadota bacterium]